ncbi:unnamed protein product [Victoria cruziana]
MGTARKRSRRVAILVALIAVMFSFKTFISVVVFLVKIFTFFIPLLLSTAAFAVVFRNLQVPGHVEEQWLEEAGEIGCMILGLHQTDPLGLSDHVPWDDHR